MQSLYIFSVHGEQGEEGRGISVIFLYGPSSSGVLISVPVTVLTMVLASGWVLLLPLVAWSNADK